MTKKPALLLLPNVLGDVAHPELYLPASVGEAVKSLDGLIAEGPQEGRRYLSHFMPMEEALKIPIAIYSEHTPDEDLEFLLEPIKKGERWGYVSDCGLPCIADPGYKLVKRARTRGLVIRAFVGPSSILLALMLSGLPAQRFAFHGYLPKEPAKRKQMIQRLELAAKKEETTQIFMEAPYRNKHLLEDLMTLLKEDTELCIAWNLTMQDQGVVSQPVNLWKKSPLPNLEKKAAIFLLH